MSKMPRHDMSITLKNGDTKSRRAGKAEGMYVPISMNFHLW
jgi:hypothetical protein